MNLSSIDPRLIFLIVAIVVVIALFVGAILFLRHRTHRRQMEKRFGPEYERLVGEMGSRKRAEARLIEREKRVAGYDIHPLAEADRARYLRVWRTVQARFVDDPGDAVAKADQLLTEAMADRGYPMADFERRSADLSIHHPMVVENYRAAHDIALRHRDGKASTEDLRQAMIHYRSLFTELVGGEDLSRAA
jgi:hypothetical protein